MAGPKISKIREALRLCFEESGNSLFKVQVFDWVYANYPNEEINRNTLQAQLYRSCVNVKSAYKSSAPKVLFYESSNKTYRLATISERTEYDKLHGHADLTNAIEESVEDSEPEVSTTFALEAHLRDYLAKNLAILESGLTLWTGNQASSIEYSVEGRRIDILARDKEGTAVVIELKLSRGHEKTLGQTLYYRGKLKQMLGLSRVRIIMVAADITDELRIASTEVTDVDLFSYALTMQVQKIDLKSQVS